VIGTDFSLGNFSPKPMDHHRMTEVFILPDAHLKEGWLEFQAPWWMHLHSAQKQSHKPSSDTLIGFSSLIAESSPGGVVFMMLQRGVE